MKQRIREIMADLVHDKDIGFQVSIGEFDNKILMQIAEKLYNRGVLDSASSISDTREDLVDTIMDLLDD